MCAVYHPTRRGLIAWVARKLELLQVNATLRWAEQDREQLARDAEALPRELRRLDRDVEVLRVRQAVLRGVR
jgi:hypothetical protein